MVSLTIKIKIMKKLIEDNYNSTVERGLITSSTTMLDFLFKIDEERQELDEAVMDSSNVEEELADVILVCLNFARHQGWDIEKELKNKVIKNFKRAKTKSNN